MIASTATSSWSIGTTISNDPNPPQPLASHTRFASLEAYLDKGFTTIFGTASGPDYFLRRERAQLLPIRRQQAPDGHVQYHLGTFRRPLRPVLPRPGLRRRGGHHRPTRRPQRVPRPLGRKHFSGDTSALGDVVKAVGELRSATAAGTLGRMEYFVSFDLMNRIAMGRAAGGGPADQTQDRRRPRISRRRGNRFPTRRPDSPVAEGDQRNRHGPAGWRLRLNKIAAEGSGGGRQGDPGDDPGRAEMVEPQQLPGAREPRRDVPGRSGKSTGQPSPTPGPS